MTGYVAFAAVADLFSFIVSLERFYVAGTHNSGTVTYTPSCPRDVRLTYAFDGLLNAGLLSQPWTPRSPVRPRLLIVS